MSDGTTKTDGAPKTHKVAFKDIKVGDLMAVTLYVKVTGKGKNAVGLDAVQVANADAGPATLELAGAELIEAASSANQFQEEVLVSKTKAAEILADLQARHDRRPFQVAFVKKDGSDRVLNGRMIPSIESPLGYSSVEDLDLPVIDAATGKSNHRVRQVDHRTIKYVVINGVKNTVK
jgi:hypothetical protein